MVFGIDSTERKKAEKYLKEHTDELERFNSAMGGRDLRMIELKKEINDVCRQAGLPLRHSEY